MNKIAGLVACMFIGSASAAPILFNNDKVGFDAATSGLTYDDFESVTSNSSTEVGFGGGTFNCTGGSYCPGFFGISTSFSVSGNQSLYFATPDSAVFNFNSAINAFGITMGGQGDVAPIDLFATTSEGDVVQILDDFTGPNVNQPGGFEYFFGLFDAGSTFTSVTISASNSGDGIFFDDLYYGATTSNVPEPGSLALIGLGLAGIGFTRKKKSA